jgi:membrane fusion protein, multidrug efflux system
MMRTLRRPRLAATILASALVALSLTACKKGGGDASAEETASKGLVIGTEAIAVAAQDTIRSGPAISGSLAAEHEAVLRAEVSGPVVQTYVEQGQRVAKGTLLAKIDDTAIRESVLSARSGFTSAQSDFAVAERQAQRSEALSKAGAIADRDLEVAKQSLAAAQSRLADARARLTNAQEQLEKTQIRAPFDGAVSNRAVSAGDVVSPGTALMTVVDPSSMRLEGSVAAQELSSIRVGAPVTFTVSGYPGKTFEGRIIRVNPTADPATRQVQILAAIPNVANNLVVGLFAEGRVTARAHLGTVVPQTAVDERGLAPTVMRLKAGKVEKVEVQLGLRDSATETVEIANGIAPGDTVLLGAAQGISPGTPVRVTDVKDEVASGK